MPTQKRSNHPPTLTAAEAHASLCGQSGAGAYGAGHPNGDSNSLQLPVEKTVHGYLPDVLLCPPPPTLPFAVGSGHGGTNIPRRVLPAERGHESLPSHADCMSGMGGG